VAIPQEVIEPRYKLKSYFDEKVGCDIYNLLQNSKFMLKNGRNLLNY
jgi:hypothetical protein